MAIWQCSNPGNDNNPIYDGNPSNDNKQKNDSNPVNDSVTFQKKTLA